MNSPLLIALASFAVGALVGGGAVGAWATSAMPASQPVEVAVAGVAEGVAAGGAVADLTPPSAGTISGVLETGADGPSLILGPEVVEANADFAEVLASAKARGAAMTVCAKQGHEATINKNEMAIVTIEGDERGPSVSQATASYRCAEISIDLSKVTAGPAGLGQVDGGL